MKHISEIGGGFPQKQSIKFANTAPDTKFATFAHYIHGCHHSKYDPMKGYSKKLAHDEPIDKTIHLLKRIESIWFQSDYRSTSSHMIIYLHHPIRANSVKLLTLRFDCFEFAEQIPTVFVKLDGEEVKLNYPMIFTNLRQLYKAYENDVEKAKSTQKNRFASPELFDENKVFELKKSRFPTEQDLNLYAHKLDVQGLFPKGRIEAFRTKYQELFFSPFKF